jgi:UDP-2-acetamido-3-amino-2,3-dideoxy-glucuronate N-acetyltransferase
LISRAAKFESVQRFHDDRGEITIFDLELDIPFESKRVFILTAVPSNTERGGHGHKKCEQYIISLSGVWEIKLFSTESRVSFQLDNKSGGVLIPVGTFITMKPLEEHSVLCVFASEKYDPDDYFYEIPELIK